MSYQSLIFYKNKYTYSKMYNYLLENKYHPKDIISNKDNFRIRLKEKDTNSNIYKFGSLSDGISVIREIPKQIKCAFYLDEE